MYLRLPRFLVCLLPVLPACHSPPPCDGSAALDPAPPQLVDGGQDQGVSDELVPPVACGSALPGPPLKPDVAEAQPGYAAELLALDLARLPDPIDYAGESKLAIAVVNYMLGRSAGTRVSLAEARAQGGLGQAVLGAFAKGSAGRLDFAFLRRGLHHFYPCARPLPADLAGLRRRYGDYRSWPSQDIPCSRAKDGPRRLYEAPELGVYVAETLVAGRVRETEVLFTRLRRDGQLDFAAYTAGGELSDRSDFASGGGSSTLATPYTCISCHLDTSGFTISRRVPSGTGAGCR